MIDYACIFTTGGMVLWCKAFCETSYKLDIVNTFMQNVLMNDKPGSKTALSKSNQYNFHDNVLKWKIMIQQDLKIVFAIVYKEILQLTLIDEFLEMLKFDFENKVWPKLEINRSVFFNLPQSYDARFNNIMVMWETKKQEKIAFNQSNALLNEKNAQRMKTFNQTNKSKKSLKKQAKKEQMAQAGDGQQDEESDNDEDQDQNLKIQNDQNQNQQVQLAREKLRQMKTNKSEKKKQAANQQQVSPQKRDSDEDEREYQRQRQIMAGPKKSVTSKDMQEIDFSVGQEDKEDEEFQKQERLREVREEFLGGDDDDLKRLGFIDSDEEIDFSKFDLVKKSEQNQKSQKGQKNGFSIFQSLTGAFQNIVGNKTLTEQDLQPILESFSDSLTDKNVSVEIAKEICSSVEKSLINTKTANFTSVKQTVQQALIDSIERLLTPKRNIDILKEALAAKKKGQVYSIVFIGVNGVGKSTSLAKVGYYLKTKGNLSVMLAGCDNFRSGAVEQLMTHAQCLEVPLYHKGYKDDPAIIAKEAIQDAKSKKYDVVLIDTAGRMQGNEPLMKALAKLVHINKPDVVLFVGEALVGNDSIDQLTKFNQSLIDFAVQEQNPRVIDGIIMTKFDTVDDKVGTALNMVYTTGKPIVFVGVGQKYPHLKKLNVQTVVNALIN